jgi:hypothetical protein
MTYAEILDRDVVLAHGRAVIDLIRKHLDRGDGDVQRGEEVVTEAELRDALPALVRAVEEQDDSPGPAPAQPGGAYLPRDPLMSALQSGMERGIDENEPAVLAAGAEDVVAEVAARDVPLAAVTDQHVPPLAEALEPGSFIPFPGDPGWSLVAIGIAWRALHGKHPYNRKPATATLGDSAQLFLFSDWATGIERAVRLSAGVRSRLTAPDAAPDRHVVHLGDVYYAGWPWEYTKRVLRAWPVPPEQPELARSWILAGNHDMYSGGKGYYETCLPDARFAAQRSPDGKPTSIFELANEHWRVLGLDTGWVDPGLWDDQREWVKRSLVEAQREGQEVVLLSHHQPFSAFRGHISPAVWDALGAAVEQRPVRAWFWGHEHRCTLYKPRPGVQHGRCIGNGGVPAHRTPQNDLCYPQWVELDYEELCACKNGGNWVRFAFAELSFVGRNLTVVYRDEDGNTFHPETL